MALRGHVFLSGGTMEYGTRFYDYGRLRTHYLVTTWGVSIAITVPVTRAERQNKRIKYAKNIRLKLLLKTGLKRNRIRRKFMHNRRIARSGKKTVH